jgi:hypothetical protein
LVETAGIERSIEPTSKADREWPLSLAANRSSRPDIPTPASGRQTYSRTNQEADGRHHYRDE